MNISTIGNGIPENYEPAVIICISGCIVALSAFAISRLSSYFIPKTHWASELKLPKNGISLEERKASASERTPRALAAKVGSYMNYPFGVVAKDCNAVAMQVLLASYKKKEQPVIICAHRSSATTSQLSLNSMIQIIEVQSPEETKQLLDENRERVIGFWMTSPQLASEDLTACFSQLSKDYKLPLHVDYTPCRILPQLSAFIKGSSCTLMVNGTGLYFSNEELLASLKLGVVKGDLNTCLYKSIMGKDGVAGDVESALDYLDCHTLGSIQAEALRCEKWAKQAKQIEIPEGISIQVFRNLVIVDLPNIDKIDAVIEKMGGHELYERAGNRAIFVVREVASSFAKDLEEAICSC